MAKRWSLLHRRRARKNRLEPADYEPWRPSGWEDVYSRYEDDCAARCGY